MEGPVITTTEGKLQGTVLRSVLGIDYLAFKGIPFAQPPLGPLRFKAPQEPFKWTGIRDASRHAGDMAMQNDTVEGPKSRGIYGGEDCLYLNVYTNAMGHKRPVMVFIHGGGFVEGSGNELFYRQDYLVTKDIVMVCINFRLGPLGFLNLGHEVAPGNQGLRDIIFALKWVQRNIAAFGGDPNNVTLFGNSSGSTTCQVLSLLPASRGLLNKVILQSGTLFISKNLTTNYKNGFRIASLLGFKSDDPVEVIKFLRTVPARDLVALEGKLLSKYERIVLGKHEYEPVIDADYTSDPVIPHPISELWKNDSHVPMIIGHTSNEFLLNLSGRFNDETYKFYNDHIEEILRNLSPLKDESGFSEVVRRAREFYLKDRPIDKDTVWNLVNLMTDFKAITGNRKVIDARNEHATAPTYVYKLTYMGDQPTIYNYDHGRQPYQGVAHADELSYLFYHYYMREDGNEDQFPKEGTKDRYVMERFLRMWYNFALTGNPTPELDDQYITTTWKPSSKDNLYYLEIGDELTLRDDRDSESRAIYENCDLGINYVNVDVRLGIFVGKCE
ncbi:esterase FE4-like [Copidosoma floridanum]|uniref:esterase FE4-like n=1 Tax=Copidosoma floridanum TaxID=29053 RepID=UPI0006C950DD|nr:esterase FE4-like [Copidosoma floridanum]